MVRKICGKRNIKETPGLQGFVLKNTGSLILGGKVPMTLSGRKEAINPQIKDKYTLSMVATGKAALI